MSLFVSPHIRRLIDLAVDEDELGFDVTSQAFFADEQGDAALVAKQDLVVAGVDVARAVYERVDPDVRCGFEVEDGQHLKRGEVLGHVSGSFVSLLRGERTALNFLQRMCGVATMTASFVRELNTPTTRIVDTRKTLPGWRELDKYSVRCGGGANHRYNLAGGVLVKDNHIAAAGGVGAAVKKARSTAPLTLRVEVEVLQLSQIDEALDAGADIVMLDNMDTATMREAVQHIRERAGDRVLIEASGNMGLSRLAELRDVGLDFISVGALTHSVVAADISMRFQSGN